MVENRAVEAAEMLLKSEDHDRLIEIVIDQAQRIVSHDRIELLEKWLETIPNSKYDDIPWLYYWQGVCRYQKDPASAKESFHRAFDITRNKKDILCAYSSLSGLVDSIIHHNFKILS